MPPDEMNPGGSVEKIDGIPLYLVTPTIANQIRTKGESVFHITVKRKRYHRYIVLVETYDEHAERLNQAAPASEKGERNE